MSQSCRIRSVKGIFAYGHECLDCVMVKLMHRVLVLDKFIMGLSCGGE